DAAEVVPETRLHARAGLRIERLTGSARRLRVRTEAGLSLPFLSALLALGPAAGMLPTGALPLQHSAGHRRALRSGGHDLPPHDGTSSAGTGAQRKSASLIGRPSFWSSMRAAARMCGMVTGSFFS